MSTILSSPLSPRSDFDLPDGSPISNSYTIQDSPPKTKYELNSSSLAMLNLMGKISDQKLKMKTLVSGELSIPTDKLTSIVDVKKFLCEGVPLDPNDIRIISKGKEIRDSVKIDQLDLKAKYFALLKSGESKNCVTLVCKENGSSKTLSVPTSTRIFRLKRELISKKITKLKGGMRLIIGGRQLHDDMILGDYLLQSAAAKKKMVSAKGEVLLHISEMMNVSHEVDVRCQLNESTNVKFSMEISSPISNMREILFRQCFIPKEFPLVISLVTKDRVLELHPDYTLIDYGITSEVKSIDVTIARFDFADAGTSSLTHLTPSPSQAFQMDEKIKTLDDINDQLLKSFPGFNVEVINLPSIAEAPTSSSVAKAISKKRPIEPEKSKSSTSMFKGMKKGFFDSNKEKSKASNAKPATSQTKPITATSPIRGSDIVLPNKKQVTSETKVAEGL